MEKLDKVIRVLELHTGVSDGKSPCPGCPYLEHEMYCMGFLEKDSLDLLKEYRSCLMGCGIRQYGMEAKK